MVAAAFDTNILIDYLREVSSAREEIHRYNQKVISIVTWIEMMVGAQERDEETRSF